MQEQGTKMYAEAVLKTHKRVIQVRLLSMISPSFHFATADLLYLSLQLTSLDSVLCPVLMEAVLKNQPEGVKLDVKEVSS